MTTEITLERLPDRVSDAVDAAIGQFLEGHGDEQLQSHRRYHGADLWMVYRHESLAEAGPGFLTRRITIGAYSDEPNHLRFIPDIIVTRPDGRFTLLPSEWEHTRLRGHVPAIDLFQHELLAYAQRDVTESEAYMSVVTTLENVWRAAISLKANQATQLVA